MTLLAPLSGNGYTAPYKLRLNTFNQGVGLIVTISAGANLQADVWCTGVDDITQANYWTTTPVTGYWNLHDILNTLTTSKNDSLAYPCVAVLLQVSKWVSGTAALAVIQSVD